MTPEKHTYEPFNLYLAGNVVHGLTTFLEKIAEQCANKYQVMLSHTLNSEITVMPVVEIEQMVLHANNDENYLRTWVINNNDQHDLSVIALDRGIITACLDLMCGGKGEYPVTTHDAAPSMGDRRMAYKMTEGLFKSLEDSFESIKTIKLRMTNKSEDAVAEQIDRSAMDFVVCVHFIISIGDVSGAVQFLFPSGSLNAYTDNSNTTDRKNMAEKLNSRMMDVSLPVTAKLGQQETSLRKALSIKPGDIIPLYNPIDADVFIGDKPFCKAQVLTDNNKLMLKIANSEAGEPEPEQEEVAKTTVAENPQEPDSQTPSAAADTETEQPARRTRTRRRRSRTASTDANRQPA